MIDDYALKYNKQKFLILFNEFILLKLVVVRDY